MKGLLTLSLAVCCAIGLNAQSFSVNTTYVSFTGDANWSEVPSPPDFPSISNISGDTIELRWVRVEENMTGWWRSSLCRASYCYSIPDDSGSFTMLPGGQDMLYVHIYPYGYVDTGNVVVKLFDVNNPADSVRIMFHADLSTGITEFQSFTYFRADLQNHQVKFSPSEDGTWTLTDATGRVVKSATLRKGESGSAEVESSGIYFFTFVNADGQSETRKLIL